LFVLRSCRWVSSEEKTAVSSISRETMMQAESLSIESKRNQENKIKSNIFEVIQHLLKDFGRKWD